MARPGPARGRAARRPGADPPAPPSAAGDSAVAAVRDAAALSAPPASQPARAGRAAQLLGSSSAGSEGHVLGGGLRRGRPRRPPVRRGVRARRRGGRAENEPRSRGPAAGAAGDPRHAGPGHGARGAFQRGHEPQAQLLEEEDPARVLLQGARLGLALAAVEHGLGRPAAKARRRAARPLPLLARLSRGLGRRAAARAPPPALLRRDGRAAAAARLGDGSHAHGTAVLSQSHRKNYDLARSSKNNEPTTESHEPPSRSYFHTNTAKVYGNVSAKSRYESPAPNNTQHSHLTAKSSSPDPTARAVEHAQCTDHTAAAAAEVEAPENPNGEGAN